MKEVNLTRQIEILSNLNFKNGYFSRNSVSDILLFREFGVRLLKWNLNSANTNTEIKYKTRKDSLNVFLGVYFQRKPLPEKINSLEKFEQELIDNISHNLYITGRSYIGLILYLDFQCHYYHKESIEVKNLYDPLVSILIRGGSVFFREGKMHINGIEFNNTNKWICLPSIENEFLKFIDDNCEFNLFSNINKKLYHKIPNQKEVEVLWKIFNQRKNI